MGVFGPKYPPGLQQVVSHAERFCQQLSRWEQAAPGEVDWVRAWLSGRTGEVEVVLALVVSDWRSDRVSIEDAAQSMTTYLLELHAAARIVFGGEDELDCCCDEVFLTEVVSGEAVTRLLPRGRPSRSTGDTWFDPCVVLRELQLDDEAEASTHGSRAVLGDPGQRKS